MRLLIKGVMAINNKIKKSFKPLLLFLFSALLHLVVILFLLKQNNWHHFQKSISVLITLNPDKQLDSIDQKALEQKLEEKKGEALDRKEEKIKDPLSLPPAKLSPRQSKFGVMWANESAITSEEMPRPQDIPQEQPALSTHQETSQEVASSKATQTTTPTPFASPIDQTPQEKNPTSQQLDVPSTHDATSITTMLDDLSDNQAQELLAELDTLEQKLKQNDEQKKESIEKQKQVPNQKKELAESTSLLNRIKSALTEAVPASTATKIVPKKFAYNPATTPAGSQQKNTTKNLISMTQGFIENIKNTGSDWLEQDGVERALTNDELKYISYEQQVSWFLQASWKRHFAQATHFTGTLNVRFLLDAQGNVSNVKIIHSSGNTILDDMVIKSIQIAAPFPPLPKYFEKTEYQVSRNIYVS